MQTLFIEYRKNEVANMTKYATLFAIINIIAYSVTFLQSITWKNFLLRVPFFISMALRIVAWLTKNRLMSQLHYILIAAIVFQHGGIILADLNPSVTQVSTYSIEV